MTFQDLALDARIIRNLTESGYTQPTPIQQNAIPHILSGKDLQASAQTGTGKTAAFMLPALQSLLTDTPEKHRDPRVLILAPTRELALQIAAEANKYSKDLPRIRTVCIFGGVSYRTQNKELQRPYDILIATPGRLLDYLRQRRISLQNVKMLIIDEADRMLDMGFVEPVDEIAAATPSDRQTLLFSATMKPGVLRLSKRLLQTPHEISIKRTQEDHSHITQRLYHTDSISHKNQLLTEILADQSIVQTIVFTATKRHADEIAQNLCEIGHSAASLHGDMNQRQRTRTIERLRSGTLRILVATDIVSRGIDIPMIGHVINFDLPMTPEDYIHRIGRTGRAGRSGAAFSFVSRKDRSMVTQIEQLLKNKIDISVIPGLEPKETAPKKTSVPFPKKSFSPRKSSFSKKPRSQGRRNTSFSSKKKV